MKTTKLGLVMGGMIAAVLVLGASGADTASAAQSDDGPSGRAAYGASAGAQPNGKTLAAPKDDSVDISTAVKSTATPAVAEATGSCPRGMVEVEGDYCATIEQRCLRWLDPDTKMRCAEFAPDTRCTGKVAHKHFCIDQFEFPNEPGAKPEVMKTWYSARDACAATGKRLCGESEWTLACEGQERLPYPYGYARNAEACNIDKPHPDVDEKAIANPATRDAEVARLWQGEPSGTREACVSPYGVHDMTGNVDEWVVNESGHPYKSGLKGGYWGPVRDRCRPMTTAHNEEFEFYQIGFRCCEDAAGDKHGKDHGAPPVEGSSGDHTISAAPSGGATAADALAGS
jgi:hypothetical protein